MPWWFFFRAYAFHYKCLESSIINGRVCPCCLLQSSVCTVVLMIMYSSVIDGNNFHCNVFIWYLLLFYCVLNYLLILKMPEILRILLYHHILIYISILINNSVRNYTRSTTLSKQQKKQCLEYRLYNYECCLF